MLDLYGRSTEENAPTNQQFFYLLGIAHAINLLGQYMVANEKLTKPIMSAIDWILWNLNEAFKLEYGENYNLETLQKLICDDLIISPVPPNSDQTIN